MRIIRYNKYINNVYIIFEYDQLKNESNIEKHKVSFEEAAEIWDDPDLLVLSAKKRGERRKMAIGKSFSMLLSVVHTKRGEAIRIISARRSTSREVQCYEQNRGNRQA